MTRAEQGHSVKVDTALFIYKELKKAGVCEKFEDVFWLSDEITEKTTEHPNPK